MTHRIHEGSVVELVDRLLYRALKMRASDIHIEPFQHFVRIRYRIDGVLADVDRLKGHLVASLVSCVKARASIDIAEKRVAQDGKFVFNYQEQQVDMRVATFPSLFGSAVVIRILDRSQACIHLEQLGLSPQLLSLFKKLLVRTTGCILVAGPTGSGKTTTLYAALEQLNGGDKTIVTLEDPVEYCIEGIVQGQVNEAVGFSFAKGVRAVLRQDPDIIMVGEIRDKQTAQTAIEAALTGHLVLSTIHTNDAPTVLMRLIEMGIEPFLLNAALTGILAQRLVRKVCEQCKVAYIPSDQEKRLLEQLSCAVEYLYQGVGCQHCVMRGYKGRIGVFELLVMSNSLRSLIMDRPLIDTVYRQALHDGMQTMLMDAIDKVKQGVISLQDYLLLV